MTVNIDLLIAGAGEPYREFFTPTPLQTVFVLANVAALPADAEVILNGEEVAEGVAGGGIFTIVGATLTWAGVPLGITDLLQVIYK